MNQPRAKFTGPDRGRDPGGQNPKLCRAIKQRYNSALACFHGAYIPPSEPPPGLGSGGRISCVDFLLHKAQLGQCRLTRHPIFFGDGSPIAEASGQSSPSLECTTQISGEVTTRSTKEVSSPGATTIWSSAQRCGPSRRDGRHIDGFLLAGQVNLDEMTEPRKRRSQLTFSAFRTEPHARRRLLPRSAS